MKRSVRAKEREDLWSWRQKVQVLLRTSDAFLWSVIVRLESPTTTARVVHIPLPASVCLVHNSLCIWMVEPQNEVTPVKPEFGGSEGMSRTWEHFEHLVETPPVRIHDSAFLLPQGVTPLLENWQLLVGVNWYCNFPALRLAHWLTGGGGITTCLVERYPTSDKGEKLPPLLLTYLLYLDTLMFLCNVFLVIILPSTLLG